ncbi:MAG: hypothetical protein ACHQ1G_06610 [Planctomycetota bacterium]
MAKRKASKRAKNRGAPVPTVEDSFARVWQLTLEAYAAKGVADGPMRRDIVRVIRRRKS